MVTEANGFLFVSGQVAIDPSGGSVPETTADQTRLIMDNIGRILGDLGLGFSDLVKATVFLADIADFESMNKVYGSFFEGDPPARSALQVVALPRPEFRVEIEVIAAR